MSMNLIHTAVVVDDHLFVAQATQRLLERNGDVRVTGLATSGEAGLELIRRHRPDVVFIDDWVPDVSGGQLAALVREALPAVRVVLFTGEDVAASAKPFWELRLNGVISKSSREDTIQLMVRCILDDQIAVPYSLLRFISFGDGMLQLDEHELLLLELLLKGATYAEIADRLQVSRRSVNNYLHKICDKLNVPTKHQALEKFIRSRYYSETGVS